VGGLLVDDLDEGGRAEVELVEEEVVGVDYLQAERPECSGGEVLHVGGDDGLRAALGGCRDDVPVARVGQPDCWLEFFPAGDQCVGEGLAHLCEPLARVNAGVDLLGGRLRLGEDPAGPQRAVQALRPAASPRPSRSSSAASLPRPRPPATRAPAGRRCQP
jgi:hypothetical protein